VRGTELRGPDYREVLRGYASKSLFIPTDDEERILQSMSSAPQHVVVSAFEGLRDYDPTEAAGGLAVPGVYIATDQLQLGDVFQPFSTVSDLVWGCVVPDIPDFCRELVAALAEE
jgi:hypothetical protein